MPRRTKQSQEIVHLPDDHPNQDLTRTEFEPPMSEEQIKTLGAWAQYAQETQMDRASYDNAVDAARFARDRAYEAARQTHAQAVEEADRQFDAASTAAWKTFYSNSDAARQDRDQRLDAIRHDLTRTELEHAMDRAQEARQRLAGDDGGYEVFGDQLHYNDEASHTHPQVGEGFRGQPVIEIHPDDRWCPRCATANAKDTWADDVCPNCGQYVAPLEAYTAFDVIREQPQDPETPAAPTTGQGTSEPTSPIVGESAAE